MFFRPHPMPQDTTMTLNPGAEAINSLPKWTPRSELFSPSFIFRDDILPPPSSSSSDFEEEEEENSESTPYQRPISGSYLYQFQKGGHSSDENLFESFQELEHIDKVFLPQLDITAIHVSPNQIASPAARSLFRKQAIHESRRALHEWRHPRGTFYRCPCGGGVKPHTYWRRKRTGAFVSCPVPHRSGALFLPAFRVKRKSARRELPRTRRPPWLKVRARTVPIWRRATEKDKEPLCLECNLCEGLEFLHHEDPEEHYWDYVREVQWRGSHPDSLVPVSTCPEELFKEVCQLRRKVKGAKGGGKATLLKKSCSRTSLSGSGSRRAGGKAGKVGTRKPPLPPFPVTPVVGDRRPKSAASVPTSARPGSGLVKKASSTTMLNSGMKRTKSILRGTGGKKY